MGYNSKLYIIDRYNRIVYSWKALLDRTVFDWSYNEEVFRTEPNPSSCWRIRERCRTKQRYISVSKKAFKEMWKRTFIEMIVFFLVLPTNISNSFVRNRNRKLITVRQQNRSCLETEINTLNTMNKACEFIDVPPRIVGGSRVTDYAINSGSPLRPFLALYQVEKAEPSSSRKHASTRQGLVLLSV